MEQIRRIMRPTDVPDQGLLCDLLWSDPDKDTAGWGENDRGVSFTFGTEVSSFYLVYQPETFTAGSIVLLSTTNHCSLGPLYLG